MQKRRLGNPFARILRAKVRIFFVILFDSSVKHAKSGRKSYPAILCSPWTPPNLGGEEISLSIPFPLLLLGGVSEGWGGMSIS